MRADAWCVAERRKLLTMVGRSPRLQLGAPKMQIAGFERHAVLLVAALWRMFTTYLEFFLIFFLFIHTRM